MISVRNVFQRIGQSASSKTLPSYRNIQNSSRSCSNKSSKEDSTELKSPKNLYPDHIQMPPSFGRVKHIFKRDINVIKDWFQGKEEPSLNFPEEVDILVIGGGIVGSSCAFWLRKIYERSNTLKILVIDKDLSYAKSSTTLSLGGIRHQFSLKENIELSLYASEFVRESAALLSVEDDDPIDLQFQPNGYLFLATEKDTKVLENNHKLQSKLGANVELLNPLKVKERFPWINTSDVALGSHGMWGEGWLDPYAYLMAFKRKAVSLGVRYIQAEIVGANFRKIQNAIDYTGRNFEECRSVQVKTPDGIVRTINFAQAVLAAGSASGEVAKIFKIGNGHGVLQFPLPVQPRKRFVHLFHTHDGPGLDCPFTINPNGMYFRREGLGGNFICGVSPAEEEEPDSSNLDVDNEEFEKLLWPYLAHRVPAFESLKHKSSWAGYYDYNVFDQNAILGHHPYVHNIMFATGFSGHGIQQAAGIGRAVSEYMKHGSYQTIDLTRFHFDRILDNEPIYESNII